MRTYPVSRDSSYTIDREGADCVARHNGKEIGRSFSYAAMVTRCVVQAAADRNPESVIVAKESES